MKKLLIGTGLLLLVGAGCASSSETAAEQAKRDALKAQTQQMAAGQQAAPAPAAPAAAPSSAPLDGTYCWNKTTAICHNILFGPGTVELVVNNRATGDLYKLTKQPSGKYSFTADEFNTITFLTVKEAGTLEAVTLTGGAAGSTQSEPQTWVRR